MIRNTILGLALALLVMGFQGKGEEEPIVRPMDPFVFRTALDERPRMVSIALHPELWVAYDLETGNLYKAWNGKVRFEGAVFNGNPTKNPTTDGYPFIEYSQTENRWSIVESGKSYAPKVYFKGYTILENRLTFRFELELANGNRISLTEYPEFNSKRDGKLTGLVRTYTTGNMPQGTELRLRFDYDAMLLSSDLKTDGKFYKVEKTKRHFDWGTLYDAEGELILNANGETELSTYFSINPESVNN